ncbi:hypothetical protein NEUTE1DRAFT_133983 [Neurospora tetrasperma FGSC 2508]|uniref:Uncharacterized protein n=1 Tax=Neurospora tetrasperma (strain FGSC 2508 / ATCC MYA-4615 / P0657) TaxID=510951 RepID=F8MZ66_NEUT8|nr:uncharacterized protein NEUTE1DRAFT_133983 [Neurospora tetrasperma FGSC 2508]EGO53658.1 hypothetical protein NEUTE1DRAFT_133983 [Neurospora tetrasperma FGSC 2508]
MASRRNSLSPPERQGTMDPGAHELPGSDTEDHYSDAISSPKAPSSPIPRTRVERVDDKPAYGEVPGTKAYSMREGDAKPDEFAIIPDPDTKLSTEEHDQRRPSTPGGRPIPMTVVEETPDSTGAVTHHEIEARHRVDSPPDVLVKADGQKIEHEKGGDNDTPIPPALKSPASIHSRDSSSDLDQPSSDSPSLGPSLLEKEEAKDDAHDNVVRNNAKTDDEQADEDESKKEEENVEVKTEQAEDGEVDDEKHEEEQSKDHDTEEGLKRDEFEDASEELENQNTNKEEAEDHFDEAEPSQENEKKVEPEEDKKDDASFDHKEEKPVENDGVNDDDGFAEAGDKAPDDDGFGDDDFGDDFAEPAQAGGDDFGDDFDDFEEGAEANNDADFGDFDDAGFDDDDFQEAEGFSAPAPAPEPQPQQPQSSLSFQIPDFTHLSASEILSLTSPYLNALFPPSPDTDGDDSSSSPIPTLNVSNGITDPIFQHPRSASLWSQLVAPPPLQPPDWIRSRIRRLFLVSLGVPVDLDEILPASKQKKLVLPSLGDPDAADDDRTGRSRRASSAAAFRSQNQNLNTTTTSNSSRTPSKQPPVNKTVAAAANTEGSANRSSRSARKGPPPEPVFDLVAAKQLCETTDEALSGMTDKELKEHVQKLEAMQGVASEVLVYWQQRTDEKIGDREAFEGVIENLVKHARKVRK